MKEKVLYIVWALLYIICVLLGFVKNPEGFGAFLIHATGVIFFLPGAILLYDGYKTRNKKQMVRVRIVSIVSLSLTLIVLVCNLLSVNASAVTGQRLYELLGLVSAPMLCFSRYAISWFLWGCLLSASFKKPAS